MNDRINLLASKCFDPRRRPESSVYFDMQKFAELIAQESIVDFYRRYLDICSEEDITVQVARYVKEHFGVEELPVCKHDWYSAKNPVVQNGSVCVICGAIDAREPEELKNENKIK